MNYCTNCESSTIFSRCEICKMIISNFPLGNVGIVKEIEKDIIVPDFEIYYGNVMFGNTDREVKVVNQDEFNRHWDISFSAIYKRQRLEFKNEHNKLQVILHENKISIEDLKTSFYLTTFASVKEMKTRNK